jgi:hypothetical protein
MKVMAAFGALPATIDAWVLTRGRTAGSGRLLVLSSSDLRMSFEMCRCECVESVLSGLGAPRAVRVLQVFEADGGLLAPSGGLPNLSEQRARRQAQRASAPAAGGGAAHGRGRGARAEGRAGARSGAARQEQRRPAPDMLYVVGLAQGDTKGITVKGL